MINWMYSWSIIKWNLPYIHSEFAVKKIEIASPECLELIHYTVSSSHPDVFFKKSVSINFAKFTAEHLHQRRF